MTVSSSAWRPREWVLIGGALLCLGGAAVGMLAAAERERPSGVRALELAYLPKGEYLKIAVLGYRQIASDLIWLKAVQHFGERKQTVEGWIWAYHVTDVVTDLDPNFVLAYQAGGTILGVWAGRPHESIALLTKGMRHNPDAWQLPFFVGYDYFFELHDTENAAKYFRLAAALPGAPEYLPKLAARMTVEAGDPQAALEFLEQLYAQTRDERLREGLAQRMKEVTAEQDIRFLEEGVRRYKMRYKKLPTRLEDLVRGDIIVEIPVDPFGGAYVLESPGGTVKSTGLRERLRAYRKG